MSETPSFGIVGGYYAMKLNPVFSKLVSVSLERYEFPNENETADHYMKRLVKMVELDFKKKQADYLILEMQAILGRLDIENAEEQTAIEEAIEQLGKIILENHLKGKVFLIQTNVPLFYIINRDLIKEMPKTLILKEACQKLNAYEQKLQKLVDATILDTTKFYFYEKQQGYLLNDRTYEAECYIDIAQKLHAHICCGSKIAKYPNPDLIMERYIRYAGKTIQWNALAVFLDESRQFDYLILSSPCKFVDEYRAELLKSKRIRYTDFLAWKQEVERVFAKNPKFRDVLLAFQAVNEGKFTEADISYRELFRNQIVSKDALRFLQNYVKESKEADPKQITPHNAGYYFAKMVGKTDEEALSYVEEGAPLLPTLVDVYGSCISRTCLRERYSGNITISANRYWFQMPLYVADQEKVDYDEAAFEGMGGLHTHNARLQLDKKLISDMESSEAEWLLIDLFGMIQPHIFSLNGFLFTDYEGKIAKRMGCEKADPLKHPQLVDWDKVLKRCDLLLDAMKAKYGERIILMEINYSYLSRGDDHVIYAPRNVKKANLYNEVFRRTFEYVKEKLNCYTVEITHGFCPDDCGFAKRISVHYSYDFYRQASEIINKIVTEEPKQKVFRDIDTDVKIRRMTEMLEQNEPATVRRFFDSALDAVVCGLDVREIRKNLSVIKQWYSQKYESREQLLENWDIAWGEPLRIAVTESDTNSSLQRPIPEDYLPEPIWGEQVTYTDEIPYAPALYIREEINATIAEVKKLQEEPSLSFICVTDVHYKSKTRKTGKPTEVTFQRMLRNMQEVMKDIDCEFVMNLGDDTDGFYKTPKQLVKISKYVQKMFLKLEKPYYKAIGNHDTNFLGTPVDVETMKEAYLSYMSDYTNIQYNPLSGQTEFYVDFPKEKVRLIVLNTQYNKLFAYHESTGEWLQKEALNTDSIILLCEHLSCVHTMNMTAKPIENRESVIEALKKHNGPIIQLCGHSHCDYDFAKYDEEYSPWLTVFENLQRCSKRRKSDLGDVTVGNSGKFRCHSREGKTTVEDCWDVVVIRPESGKINFVRFGVGGNREYDFPIVGKK